MKNKYQQRADELWEKYQSLDSSNKIFFCETMTPYMWGYLQEGSDNLEFNNVTEAFFDRVDSLLKSLTNENTTTNP